MSCFEGVCEVGLACVEGSAEICNGADDDCDGLTDEEQGTEVCNGLDDDCDGEFDEGIGATVEVCNRVDDDCDGRIDEDVPTMNDVCNMVDDDCDGRVDEGTDEVCNNLDDDCDGETDNEQGTPLCDEDSICQGACVLRSCANDTERFGCDLSVDYCDTSVTPAVCRTTPPRDCENDGQCEEDQRCVEAIGQCRDITPLGTACTSDATCVDGTFCADLDAVGIADMRTCTRTCCSKEDCPNGSVCASDHTGARLCVLEGQVGLPDDTNCDDHVDCASGYCRNGGTCQPMCSSDADCDSGEACLRLAASSDSSTNTTGCFNAGTRRENGESCSVNEQCQSYFCYGLTRRCREACGAVGECPSNEGCTSIPVEGGPINICLTENPMGRAGTTCTVNGQCDSLRCHNGSCVAPCCSDSTCTSDRECRPIQTGDFWPTYCVPPSP
ncbi:MAG: MopE-related protein [Polyangiales bacterium]